MTYSVETFTWVNDEDLQHWINLQAQKGMQLCEVFGYKADLESGEVSAVFVFAVKI